MLARITVAGVSQCILGYLAGGCLHCAIEACDGNPLSYFICGCVLRCACRHRERSVYHHGEANDERQLRTHCRERRSNYESGSEEECFTIISSQLSNPGLIVPDPGSRGEGRYVYLLSANQLFRYIDDQFKIILRLSN